MNEKTEIERIVMQRVHLIRALRFAISSGTLSMFVSFLALWGIGREVWIGHVLQNAPKNPIDLVRFYLYAFGHTRPVVQALIVLTVAALFYCAREIARALAVISAPKVTS